MYQLIPYIERLVGARATARRLAARTLQRRWRVESTGSSTAPRSSHVRRQASAPSTTACRRTSRGCCSGPGSSSATCTRTISTRARSPTISAQTRSSRAHAQRVARRLPRARRARRSSRSIPTRRRCYGASTRRSSTTTTFACAATSRCSPSGRRRRRPALSGKVVLHDSCVYARYENVVQRAARAAGHDRPHGRRADSCGEADVVLRRPGRGAVPRQGGGRRREARRAACARLRPTA